MPVPAGGGSADMLATEADLAAALQINLEDLDLPSARLALECATAIVQGVVGQRLVEVIDDPFELPAPYGSTLLFPERPVSSVSAVSVAGVTLAEGTASGTYRRVAGGLWRECGWSSLAGPSTVTGVYSHGWPVGHQDLQLGRSAALSLAKGTYTNPDGVYSEKIDDYSVAFEKAASAMEASPFLQKALRRKYGEKAQFVAVA